MRLAKALPSCPLKPTEHRGHRLGGHPRGRPGLPDNGHHAPDLQRGLWRDCGPGCTHPHPGVCLVGCACVGVGRQRVAYGVVAGLAAHTLIQLWSGGRLCCTDRCACMPQTLAFLSPLHQFMPSLPPCQVLSFFLDMLRAVVKGGPPSKREILLNVSQSAARTRAARAV